MVKRVSRSTSQPSTSEISTSELSKSESEQQLQLSFEGVETDPGPSSRVESLAPESPALERVEFDPTPAATSGGGFSQHRASSPIVRSATRYRWPAEATTDGDPSATETTPEGVPAVDHPTASTGIGSWLHTVRRQLIARRLGAHTPAAREQLASRARTFLNHTRELQLEATRPCPVQAVEATATDEGAGTLVASLTLIGFVLALAFLIA